MLFPRRSHISSWSCRPADLPHHPSRTLALCPRYFQPRTSRSIIGESAFATLFRRFREGDQAFRDGAFKIIPQVVKGPWIVKQSVGSGSSSVPVLLGKRLDIDYFTGAGYVEVDVNVHSNAVASSITKMVRGMTRMVVIDIAFLLEGKEDDELPERLIGVFRMDHMRMDAATGVDGVRRSSDSSCSCSSATSSDSSSRGGRSARTWRNRIPRPGASTRTTCPSQCGSLEAPGRPQRGVGASPQPKDGAATAVESDNYFDCYL